MRQQERLKRELEEREQEMRKRLELEILKLQEEKVSIEMSIRGLFEKDQCGLHLNSIRLFSKIVLPLIL